MGLALTLRKKEKKTTEWQEYQQLMFKQEMQKQLLFENKFTNTIILLDFYKWKIVTTNYKWCVYQQMVCND